MLGVTPCLEPGHRPFQVPASHPDIALGCGQVLVAHEGLKVCGWYPGRRSFGPEGVA